MNKQIAHQKLIRDKMQKEDAWNLFGEWWKDVDTDIKKAVVKEIDYRTASNLIKNTSILSQKPANASSIELSRTSYII